MSFLGKIGTMLGSTPQASVAASSARSVAKERLSVILASQRGSELLDGVDMEALQEDVMQVVKKHISIAKSNGPMQMNLNSVGDVNLFEMSVELEANGNRRAGSASTSINLGKAV